MKTRLRVGVALATILSLFVSAATSFAAASITVSPTAGAIGNSAAVNGGGFTANAMVRILFGGSGGPQVGSASSDGTGNLPSLMITVPNVTGGTYQVVATDGVNTASTSFSVPFSLALSPTSGGSGTTVSVSGTGFVSGEAVSIAWDQGGSQLTRATANTNGGLSASFLAPNGTGNHQVVATGQTSQFTVATTFTLSGPGNVGGASLTLNPTSGAAGSQVNLSGTGFSPNESVNLAVDDTAFTSLTTDGNGNFVTSVTLPSPLAFGNRTLRATGVSSGHSASVVFDVTNGRPERASVTCTTENSRPGKGSGDRNHCHTGTQGEDQNHGHGRAHGNQGDNPEGDD